MKIIITFMLMIQVVLFSHPTKAQDLTREYMGQALVVSHPDLPNVSIQISDGAAQSLFLELLKKHKPFLCGSDVAVMGQNIMCKSYIPYTYNSADENLPIKDPAYHCVMVLDKNLGLIDPGMICPSPSIIGVTSGLGGKTYVDPNIDLDKFINGKFDINGELDKLYRKEGDTLGTNCSPLISSTCVCSETSK